MRDDVVDYPQCERCAHDWHGLTCQAQVVPTARGGRRTDVCACAPADPVAA